eukprot:m.193534 g.193534  ORF g.193534 m.193534 type:complete len:663 (+) comp18946_c0_seq1:59-2047(+)
MAPTGRGWLVVVLANVFFACASFSIAIPTLYGYLAQLAGTRAPLGSRPLFYALTVSVYSIGEAVGSVVFGWGYAKAPGPKTAILATIFVGLAGSLLFAGAGMYAVKDPSATAAWIAFTGRAVQGLWTGGQQTVEQAFLSEYVDPRDLTAVTASLGSAAVLGFILGPSFATALDFVHVTVDGYTANGDTAPGLFMVVIAVAMLVMTATLFRVGDVNSEGNDDDDNDEEAAPLLSVDANNVVGVYEDDKDNDSDICFRHHADRIGQSQPGSPSQLAQSHQAKLAKADNDGGYTVPRFENLDPTADVCPTPPATVGLVLCLSAFFVHFYSFAVYETIMTPLVPELYGWSANRVDVLFVGAGIVSLIASLTVKFVSPFVSDTQLLVASLVLGSIGNAIMIDIPGYAQGKGGPPPSWGFVTGFVLLNIAFPIGRNVVLGLYSKIIGPCPQGGYMGAIIALGAVPRAVGPFWAVYALCIPERRQAHPQRYPATLCHTKPSTKPETYILFGTTAVAFAVMTIVVAVAAARGLLAPHPDLLLGQDSAATDLRNAPQTEHDTDTDNDNDNDHDSETRSSRSDVSLVGEMASVAWSRRRSTAFAMADRRASALCVYPGQTPTRWGSFVPARQLSAEEEPSPLAARRRTRVSVALFGEPRESWPSRPPQFHAT